MSTASSRPSPQATAARERGDACPGALRLHPADDGALARVRIPGGVLTLPQAEALADAAGRLGDGDLHLTSRGNVQLRGLADGCGAELAALLDAAGLLPSSAHERVRNVVASPLSGLDGRGFTGVRPWLTALDAQVCASGPARELSGRFLFALDDGRGDVAGLGADVTLRAAADGGAVLWAGPLDSDRWIAERLWVAHRDAPRAALLAAETFVGFGAGIGDGISRDGGGLGGEGGGGGRDRGGLGGNGGGSGRDRGGSGRGGGGATVWRVAELGDARGAFNRALRARLAVAGIAFRAANGEPVATPDSAGPPPGIAGSALSVHVPLGRITPPQWRALIRAAAGELRLTPWRGVVVPTGGAGPERAVGSAGTAADSAGAEADLTGVGGGPEADSDGAVADFTGMAADLAEVAAGLTATGLVTAPGSPWSRVGACVGRPGCARSRADVRADAERALPGVARARLPVYWSGCERRCGHPAGDHIDVVATAPDDHGQGYDLSVVTGGHRAPPVRATGPTDLITALTALAP
ncbi:cobalamin biosynthesis protein CobG [Streptomyces sp. NPDC093252]|uniref:cobalamin biosynthesis protein CobG n=1 Tax=Streptomyces sp. NPDC093252 TaxID=3154980 RepID=UPI0034378982